jgi:apolipoprotein N-acyltransferase
MGIISSLPWAVLGGVMAYCFLGSAPYPITLWTAPILIMHFAHSLPPAKGLPIILLVFVIASGTANIGILPVQGIAYFVMVVLEGIALTLPYLADRLLAFRLPGVAPTLIFPLAWVTVDFLVSRFSPSGSWGLSGYTQHGVLPLVQVASVAGLFGITFLAGWSASVVNWAWDHQLAWGQVRVPVLLFSIVFTLTMLAGWFRLATSSPPARNVRASVVTYPREMFKPGEATRIRFGQVGDEEKEPLRRKTLELQDWYLSTSQGEARAGSRIVLWPELNLLVFKEDEPAFLERAKSLARNEGVYLVMGMASVELGVKRPLENKAMLINDSGVVLCSYMKGHPVVGWEDNLQKSADTRPFVGNTAFGRTAVAICFDMDFPSFIRQAGEERAELMLVPANDWREIKDIHPWMAQFRAVENGATMIRATSTGLSSVVDPYGRTLAEMDHFVPGAGVMVAQVPLASTRTLYVRIGDAFAWICLLSLLVLGGWGALRQGGA